MPSPRDTAAVGRRVGLSRCSVASSPEHVVGMKRVHVSATPPRNDLLYVRSGCSGLVDLLFFLLPAMEEDRITFYIPEVRCDHVAGCGLIRVLHHSIGGGEDGKLSVYLQHL